MLDTHNPVHSTNEFALLNFFRSMAHLAHISLMHGKDIKLLIKVTSELTSFPEFKILLEHTPLVPSPQSYLVSGTHCSIFCVIVVHISAKMTEVKKCHVLVGGTWGLSYLFCSKVSASEKLNRS